MVFSLSFLYPDSADINNLYSGGGAQKMHRKRKAGNKTEAAAVFLCFLPDAKTVILIRMR